MPEENTLSPREEEILQLVATGMSNREIAQELFISPNTVKVHMRNIFEKLSVSSRTEATLYGIEQGIVDVPGGGNQGESVRQPTWREEIRKFTWAWVGVGLLLSVFLVTFTSNVLLPPPTLETGALIDVGNILERWQELSPMPEPRAKMAAAAYDGNIYAIAGEGPEGVSGSVFRYLTEEDTWERLSDKPTPVSEVDGVLIGEKIYVPGGKRADGQPTGVLEIYDPRWDSWETGAPLPKAISAYALADFEGQLYLFGGWDGENALVDVLIYDLSTDTWQEGSPMSTARYYAGAAEAGDRIYVMGGWDGRMALNISESYLPARDQNQENAWNIETPMPISLYGMSVEAVTDIIFLVGGDSTDESETGQMYYSINQKNWFIDEPTDDGRTSIMHPSSVAMGGFIYNFGGEMGDQIVARAETFQALYTILLPFTINQ